jgi:hypothetical protein
MFDVSIDTDQDVAIVSHRAVRVAVTADTERPSIWYRLSRDWYRLYRDAAVHSLKFLLIRRCWVDVRPNWIDQPTTPTETRLRLDPRWS